MDELAGPRVEGATQVAFHVLARGEDDELLAPAHVGRADARVQVHVGLVDVKHLVLGAGPVDQLIDLVQDSPPTANRDAQARPGSPAADLVREKHVPNVTGAELHVGVHDQLRGQELERPGGPLPPVVSRRTVDVADEPLLDLGRHLPRNPLGASVDQAVLAEVLEAVDRPVDGGAGTARHLGNFRWLVPSVKQEQDPGAERLDAAAGLLEESDHSSSLPSVEPKDYVHPGGSPGLEWCLATSLVAQLVPLSDLSDPASVQAI
jgi:hypothetical protein